MKYRAAIEMLKQGHLIVWLFQKVLARMKGRKRGGMEMKNSCAWILAAVVVMNCLVSFALASTEIIIKARVDGPSELIVTADGFQWRNGANAKPGRHMGRNEPTFVNDVAWIPVWGEQEEDRGVDTSDLLPWPIESLDLEFVLLAIGEEAEVTTVEPRTAPTLTYGTDSLIITIPDPERGSRWYVLALTTRE